MKQLLAFIFIFSLFATPEVNANCIRDQDGRVVCGGGQCERDRYGKVFCAQPGGGAMKDRYGVVVCGIGYCERNRDGDVYCSLTRGGGAALNSYGEVKCLNGCHAASDELCTAGQ